MTPPLPDRQRDAAARSAPRPAEISAARALACAAAVTIAAQTGCMNRAEGGFSTPQTECAPAAQARLTVPTDSAPLSEAEQDAIATSIAASIRRGYAQAERIARDRPPCTDVAADRYLQALSLVGDDQQCLDYASECLATELPEDPDAPGFIGPRLAFLGARCAERLDDYERAYALYDVATADVECRDLGGRVLSFARFAASTQYDDQLAAILARAPAFAGADAALAERAIVYLVTGNLPAAGAGAAASDPGLPVPSAAEVFTFLERHLAGDDPALRDQLLAAYGHRWRYRERDRFLRFLLDNFARADRDPLADEPFGLLPALPELAYSALYRAGETGLPRARAVYDAYRPFASPSRWFPREENTYTYGELYEQICRQQLSRGPQYEAYRDLSERWRAGALSAEQAAEAGREVMAESGERADLWTFVGDMEQLRGDDDAAIAAYLRAHSLCPYYNRAHFGLIEVRANRGYRNLGDNDERLAAAREAVAALPYGDSLRAYVQNYAALAAGDRGQVDDSGDTDGVMRLKYSLGFWAPYIDGLLAAGQSFYVKEGYELLSEAPALGFIRDTRVAYPGDYRLLDDIRGTGGNPVVTARGEIMRAAVGGYNTALHEVSHQVHLNAPEPLSACITRLYQAAAAREVFTDPYAAINEVEYFAQAVSFYAVPADAPLRDGLNRGHLLAVDRDLHDFIAAIEAAGAAADGATAPNLDALGAVPCPL
ncbi:MAG: hypothetical protein Tsb0020_39060 [Haliangiales bacterium]